MITLSVCYFQRKVSNKISVKFQICFALWSYFTQARSYGVMVSTLDSESSDPSSNLGRTWYFLFVMGQLAFSKHNFVWLLLGCRSTVYSRDSSVGRALDWRSKGPRFDPGSRHFATACLSFLSCFFFQIKRQMISATDSLWIFTKLHPTKKSEAPPRFELGISCLLDRRFNQLSHGALPTAAGMGVDLILVAANWER